MKFLKIFIIFFISNNLFSQSNYGNFVELKRLFIQEKYDLISQMDNNFDKKSEFYPYTLFYKGVSSYKIKSNKISKSYFEEILKSYPKWSQINEVYHWLVKINIENKNLDQALKNLSKINDLEIKDILYPQIDPLQNHYF